MWMIIFFIPDTYVAVVGCLDVSTHWMQGVEQSKLEYQDSSLVWSSILTQYSKIQRKFNNCKVMTIFFWESNTAVAAVWKEPKEWFEEKKFK